MQEGDRFVRACQKGQAWIQEKSQICGFVGWKRYVLTSGTTISVPVKIHLSPAFPCSTVSCRKITSIDLGIDPDYNPEVSLRKEMGVMDIQGSHLHFLEFLIFANQ